MMIEQAWLMELVRDALADVDARRARRRAVLATIDRADFPGFSEAQIERGLTTPALTDRA